jgi:hypothetical protein
MLAGLLARLKTPNDNLQCVDHKSVFVLIITPFLVNTTTHDVNDSDCSAIR